MECCYSAALPGGGTCLQERWLEAKFLICNPISRGRKKRKQLSFLVRKPCPDVPRWEGRGVLSKCSSFPVPPPLQEALSCFTVCTEQEVAESTGVCDCSVVTLIACLGRKRLTSQGTWEENRSQSPDFLATWLLRLDCFAELSQRWCGKPEFLEITRYDSKRVTMFKTTAGWWKILSRSCKLLQITC